MEDVDKKIKTAMLVLVWVCMGLNLEIAGPTMIDLKMRFDSTYEAVARAVSANGLGMFLGALLGGLLVDIMGPWQDLIITVAQLLSTTAVLLMPFVGDVNMLWFMFFATGTSMGAVNVGAKAYGTDAQRRSPLIFFFASCIFADHVSVYRYVVGARGQRILLNMWKSKAPTPMHILHMGFGIGAIAAPLIANNFLAELKFDDTSTNTSTAIPTSRDDQKYIVVKESRVPLAFITIGILTAVLSSPFFIHPIYTCYKRSRRLGYESSDAEPSDRAPNTLRSMIDPAAYSNGSRKFGIFVFLHLVFYYVNSVGGEQMFGNFIRTFSVDELHFPRNEASYLDTAYWASFTLGRLLAAFVAHYIAIRTILLADAVMNAIAVMCLMIFTAKSHAFLWTFTCIVGFTIGPLFPAFISFTNTQIEVGGVVLTLIMFAAGIGDMFYIWIAGILYDSHGPRTILYALAVAALLVLSTAVTFVSSTYKRGDRFSRSRLGDTEELVDDIVVNGTDDNVVNGTDPPEQSQPTTYNTL